MEAEAKRKPEEGRWLEQSLFSSVKEDDALISKALGGLKLGAMFAGKVAAQMVSNAIGGGDVSSVKLEEASQNLATLPQMAKNVRDLRKTLGSLVEKIKFDGKPVKIVFFIDDLDRVPPATAVEILDMTKNVFDMPQCVFVLAIDYEVIVKGLEKKFGKKTSENEREFRQYFDKIIQIPFTMPLGAYGKNVSELLKTAFKELGYKDEQEDNALMVSLGLDATLATGGIPRSIKRVLNTLSLLLHINNARQKQESDSQPSLPKDIEARFIIVALHVNFPEIARRLMERPDFTQWDPETLDSVWNLQLDEHRSELELLSSDNLFNDPWEQVVYCIAAGSPWLKSQAKNLSELLNRLLASLGGDRENATSMPEEGLLKLQDILNQISVVSVDPTPKLEFSKVNLKNSPVTKYFVDLQNALHQTSDVFPAHDEEVAEYDDGIYRYSFDLHAPNMVYGEFDWQEADEKLVLYICGTKPGKKQDWEDHIVKMKPEDYKWKWEDRNFYYYQRLPFTKADFSSMDKIPQLVEKTMAIYKALEKTQAKMYK